MCPCHLLTPTFLPSFSPQNFPVAIQCVSELRVGIARIQRLLERRSMDTTNYTKLEGAIPLPGVPAVLIENATFSWFSGVGHRDADTDADSGAYVDTLSRITVSLPSGSLLAVVGPVGSGEGEN